VLCYIRAAEAEGDLVAAGPAEAGGGIEHALRAAGNQANDFREGQGGDEARVGHPGAIGKGEQLVLRVNLHHLLVEFDIDLAAAGIHDAAEAALDGVLHVAGVVEILLLLSIGTTEDFLQRGAADALANPAGFHVHRFLAPVFAGVGGSEVLGKVVTVLGAEPGIVVGDFGGIRLRAVDEVCDDAYFFFRGQCGQIADGGVFEPGALVVVVGDGGVGVQGGG